MKQTLMTAALFLGLACTLGAQEGPLQLTGLMGIGLDSMPGLAPDQVPLFSNVIKTPDTVTFRYWINEKFSWEGQLAASYSTQPSSTTATSATKAYGVGTAFKWNFKRPTETSLAQLLVGLDLSSFVQGPDSTGATQTTSTFSLYVGPGFEYFMPFMRSLSLEGSLRLRVAATSTKSDQGSQAVQSSSSVAISANNFTPLTLSMHYYF